MKRLEGYRNWALITGASSGIGQAFAQALAKENFNLVLVARRKALLEEQASALRSEFSIQTRIIESDLCRTDSVKNLYDACSDLDIGLVIPSAGIDEMGQFADKNFADLQRMIHLNVTVPTELAHRFSRKMQHRQQAGIILVSSLFAYQGIPNFATYAATKSYILTLGEALHAEMKKLGIDVLVLSPGLTNTPFSQGMEINFRRLPMIAQQPDAVARTGLRNIGRSMSVVSGLLNKFYAWENRLIPRSWPVNLFGFLINNAIRSFKKRQHSEATS